MSAKSAAKQANSVLAHTFGVPNEESFRHCLKDRARAQECKEVVSSRIRDLAQRLAMPLDVPSWGPEGRKRRDFNWRPKQSPAQTAQGDKLISPAQREAIVDNLERSERYKRFSGLYAFFVLLAIAIAAGALFVDYQIMNEFWTRALANEFMEVPASLANSVVSKSLQVVFATVAFHFLLSKLPEFGRTIFILLFFALTFAMVAGFGFLNAQMSLPAEMGGIAGSVQSESNSLSQALSSLGLSGGEADTTAAAPESAAAPVGATEMRQIEWLTWLVSPGVVFLVVTAIGALCIHVAENNVQNFVKSREYGRRLRRVQELDLLERYKAMIDRYAAQETTVQSEKSDVHAAGNHVVMLERRQRA